MSSLEATIKQLIDERLKELGVYRPAPSTPAKPARPTIANQQLDGDETEFCFKCGEAGNPHVKKDGGSRFWTCSDASCGYVAQNGKFYQSAWDEENWHERKERAERYAAS